jgi:hypothetical protein
MANCLQDLNLTIPNLKEKLAMMPDPAPQVTNFLDSVKYSTPFASE